MALFDVSDVNNPTQLSQTIIGDSRTTSAILTNPKALLFSKEKQLLAIPVNNYSEDFEIDSSIDSYSSIVDSYTNYNKSYVSEGYFVYKININEEISFWYLLILYKERKYFNEKLCFSRITLSFRWFIILTMGL